MSSWFTNGAMNFRDGATVVGSDGCGCCGGGSGDQVCGDLFPHNLCLLAQGGYTEESQWTYSATVSQPAAPDNNGQISVSDTRTREYSTACAASPFQQLASTGGTEEYADAIRDEVSGSFDYVTFGRTQVLFTGDGFTFPPSTVLYCTGFANVFGVLTIEFRLALIVSPDGSSALLPLATNEEEEDEQFISSYLRTNPTGPGGSSGVPSIYTSGTLSNDASTPTTVTLTSSVSTSGNCQDGYVFSVSGSASRSTASELGADYQVAFSINVPAPPTAVNPDYTEFVAPTIDPDGEDAPEVDVIDGLPFVIIGANGEPIPPEAICSHTPTAIQVANLLGLELCDICPNDPSCSDGTPTATAPPPFGIPDNMIQGSNFNCSGCGDG